MPKPMKTALDRLTALQAEIASLEGRAAKQKAAIRAQETRTRQRRAFLLGECLLAQENLSAGFSRDLAQMLDGFLKKPADRKILEGWLAPAESGATSADVPQAARG